MGKTHKEGEHENTDWGEEGQVNLSLASQQLNARRWGWALAQQPLGKSSRVSIMAQPREQGAAYLII